MHEEDEYSGPSKSALKRQMTALQKLGQQLVGLSEAELSRIPIESEQLLHAIDEARRIRSNSAKRRQMQYIGKVMRNIDAQPIEKALADMHQQRQYSAETFHQLEQFRDQLQAEGMAAIEAVMLRFPAADRQHLRQLVRSQQREAAAGKPPAANRKIFKYLRELAEAD
jgi:ribosome-associated protein